MNVGRVIKINVSFQTFHKIRSPLQKEEIVYPRNPNHPVSPTLNPATRRSHQTDPLPSPFNSHPTETGLSRPSLSPSDASVRSWFANTTRSLGCTVTVDEMGNQFAIRAGRRPGPPTVAGSHLDSQPTGGRYDGVLGVVAGVEMLRVLEESGQQGETEFPVGVVNWTK